MKRLTMIASVACLLALLSCQKAETQQQRDKDEEHGLVVAQEPSKRMPLGSFGLPHSEV